MIKLSYATNGLISLDLISAIDEVDKAGYDGIELSFHKTQFNPYEFTEKDLIQLKFEFKKRRIKPACISTATFFFLSERPHEPSIMCIDQAGRKQRIHLIKRGIEIAKVLDVPIITFGSGFIREDHIWNPSIDPKKLLIEGINECLEDIGDKILVIEPEPGMYIETINQAIDLIEEVNSPNFRLHVDICHLFCSEKDYISSLARAVPYTKYLHISDTTDGSNLKLLEVTGEVNLDFDFASYLLYFKETSDFLFINNDRAIYFYDRYPSEIDKEKIRAYSNNGVEFIDYNKLYRGPSEKDPEINTYIVSVPGLSFCVLDRAVPILKYLRDGSIILDKMVANTLTGKVHFHEIPGVGQVNFRKCFEVLEDRYFDGYATVELYHHINNWEKALKDSLRCLKQCLKQKEEVLC